MTITQRLAGMTMVLVATAGLFGAVGGLGGGTSAPTAPSSGHPTVPQSTIEYLADVNR